jgi:hypothetical protein
VACTTVSKKVTTAKLSSSSSFKTFWKRTITPYLIFRPFSKKKKTSSPKNLSLACTIERLWFTAGCTTMQFTGLRSWMNWRRWNCTTRSLWILSKRPNKPKIQMSVSRHPMTRLSLMVRKLISPHRQSRKVSKRRTDFQQNWSKNGWFQKKHTWTWWVHTWNFLSARTCYATCYLNNQCPKVSG